MAITLITGPEHAVFNEDVPRHFRNELKAALITFVRNKPNTSSCFLFTATLERYRGDKGRDSWCISRS
jgi:hypothetical protein